MHNTIRAVLISVSVAVCLSACGGSMADSVHDGVDGDGQVHEEACSTCSTNDGTGADPTYTPMRVKLTVRLRNTSAETRQCSDIVLAKSSASGTVTTTVAAGGAVPPGGEIVGYATYYQWDTLSINGGCARLGFPTYDDVYGSFPVTMSSNKDCAIIYEMTGEIASARMECRNT